MRGGWREYLPPAYKMKTRDVSISVGVGERYGSDAECAKAAIQRFGRAVGKVDDSHCGSRPFFEECAPCWTRASKRSLMQCRKVPVHAVRRVGLRNLLFGIRAISATGQESAAQTMSGTACGIQPHPFGKGFTTNATVC